MSADDLHAHGEAVAHAGHHAARVAGQVGDEGHCREARDLRRVELAEPARGRMDDRREAADRRTEKDVVLFEQRIELAAHLHAHAVGALPIALRQSAPEPQDHPRVRRDLRRVIAQVRPPAALPSAPGAMPLATATAPPDDEPPGIRAGSQGFTGVPCHGFTPVGWMPNSCMLVLAKITAPAARSRCTRGASTGIGLVRNFVPLVDGKPATSMQSLTATAIPSRAESGFPALNRARAASASAGPGGAR